MADRRHGVQQHDQGAASSEPATSERSAVPATPERGAGIDGFAWALWPWMNWLLPVFLVTQGLFGAGGGWVALTLILTSPVLVPLAGFLGSLPRSILRRRGHASTPGPVTAMLFVHWWGWFTATITLGDVDDMEPRPSALRSGLWSPLSTVIEGRIFAAAVLVAVLAWIGILVCACLLRPAGPVRRKWTVVAWVTAFALPLLLAGAVQAGVVATAAQTDVAGDTVAEVQATPLEDRVARAGERYEATQSALSQVRGLIADDGWTVTDGNFVAVVYECRAASADCYAFRAGFFLEPEEATVDFDILRPQLVEQGWDVSGQGSITAVDGEGRTLTVSRKGGDRLFAEIVSPYWWGDDFELSEAMGRFDRIPTDDGADLVFAWDEWPPL